MSARELSRRYGEGETAVNALREVDLEIRREQLTAVMGPSGSGKSTLMHLLAGLDRPTSGSVAVDGTELSALDDGALTRLRRDRLGFVFQGYNLVPVLSAEENILLPFTLAGLDPIARGSDELVSAVGIGDRLPTCRRSSLVASSSASRSRGRWSASRRWSSPTNRQATGLDRLRRGARAAAASRRRVRADDRDGHARRRRRGLSPTAWSSWPTGGSCATNSPGTPRRSSS